MDNNKKTWSGRFSEPVSALVERYTASIHFDYRLAEEDIRGSLAHARMLAARGIITQEDLAAIERGLGQIREEIREGRFDWSRQLE
ncbi:MAG: lyase family protein, partial [Nitrosomonas sp.]|nr:lyase family protein [Nitrosomonas sp.]